MRLRFLLLILFSVITVMAQSGLKNPAFVANLYPQTVTPPATYLINQNFEGAGYDNSESWTEGSNPDEDYTGLVLRGSQSLRITTISSFTYTSYSGQTTVYAFGDIQFTSLPSGAGQVGIISIATAAVAATLAAFEVNSAGDCTILANGTSSSASATTLATGTTYHWWLTFVSGGTCELAISTSTTKPSSDGGGNVFLQKTGAAGTAETISIYAGGAGAADFVLDHVLVDDVAIGDNP